MAVSKLRNRVVLFRLTQDEYDHVQQACAEGSARSISDFARSRILSGAPADGPSLAQIEAKVADLSRAVENLTRMLSQGMNIDEGHARPRAATATAGHPASVFLASSGD